MEKLYPLDWPDQHHPQSWALLGMGLSIQQMNKIMRHLVDKLGFTFQLPDEVSSWKATLVVDYPLDLDAEKYPNQVRATVGEKLCLTIPGGVATAVAVTSPLPPGLKLDVNAGVLRGVVEQPGIYQLSATIGPQVKYDPLGSVGDASSVGEWIAYDQPRYKPAPVELPVTTEDKTPEEIEQIIVALQEAQRVKAMERAANGN